ncbi:hypothetical protein [Sphingomonas sp. PP-CE-1G-424]|uniref:hypothetical protein n=1 Tax=Sphingomonas sp. PP-CE-1G-424 TaxID=2135658 RepID=UPI00105699A7|nr:hypothetical protein [Sphingomonas sp. PP-CE-1G-424]TCP66289.1 hypothetical protein C8J43_1059 [Sphingomonas sp. PP-CE-1G-424]
MSIETWANVLSAAGTVAAAAVAAYAARLVLTQVRFQFVPKILVQRQQYQIRTTGSIKTDFWWTPPGEDARYQNGGSEDYRFCLLNVGNGAAFDIRVFAEIEYQTIYDDVMGKLAPYFPGLTVQNDDFGCQVRDGGEVIGGFRLPGESFGIVEFIGPSATAERSQRFIIDPNLAFFATCYAHYLRSAHEQELNARQTQKIPVNFRIEYLDASGERQITRQAMALSISGGRYKEDGSDGVSIIGLSEL